jgi:pimeloyl-ACP methyl ester carboxylesterase
MLYRLLPLAAALALSLTLGGCASMGAVSSPDLALQAKYTNQYSRWIDIDGARIHYRDEGHGPTVVLLHGIASSLQTWDGWAQALRGQYRVIRLDLPGFGLTGPLPNHNYEPDAQLALLDKMFTRLGLKHFSLAGNSLGGYFSWRYAVAYPNKVDKLILLDAPAYPQDTPGIINLLNTPVVGDLGRYMAPRFMFRQTLESVYGDPSKVTDQLVDRYYELATHQGNRHDFVDIARMIKRYAGTEPVGINRIKAPTLLMWGAEDRWVPPQLALRWQKDLPLARFVFFKGVGHMPMEEAPALSAQDALRFLRGEQLPEVIVHERPTPVRTAS